MDHEMRDGFGRHLEDSAVGDVFSDRSRRGFSQEMNVDEQSRSASAEGDPPDSSRNPVFSVVVPVYNSEASLEELTRRLSETFDAMGVTFEIIFVDDGSRDGSLEVLRSLHERYPGKVRVISLYRNHGQQAALMCGFGYCTGDLVVTLDDDLQHSPEEIPALYATLQGGYDVVIGSYEARAHHRFRNIGSSVVRWLNHRIFDLPGDLKLTSYRMIRIDIVRHLLTFRTSFPYISGMILSTTHRVANAQVSHQPRPHGRSGYSLPKLVKLSYNLLVNYSSIPLRLIGYVGISASMLSFAAGSVFAVRQVLTGGAPEGWTSLFVLLSFFSGCIFAMLFVMAEYVSRLLTEVARPQTPLVREELE